MPAEPLLTYSVSPDTVAVSVGAGISEANLTVTITNMTGHPVALASMTLTLPQGTGADALIAPNTQFSHSAVASSNGRGWAPTGRRNQVTLVPGTTDGYDTLAPNDQLVFTLSGLRITTGGAGQKVAIDIEEVQHNTPAAHGPLPVDKVNPGFQIQTFYSDLSNVDVGKPVILTWKVLQAASWQVTARIVNLAGPQGPGDDDHVIAQGTTGGGTVPHQLRGATLFTLTARGVSAGQDVHLTSQILVTVNQPDIRFSAFPPFVSRGQSVALRWVTTDAAQLRLYTAPFSGTPKPFDDLTKSPVGELSVTPDVSATYTLCAFASTDPNARPAREESRTIVVAVPIWTQDPTVAPFVRPPAPGQTFSLSWKVESAAACLLKCDLEGFTPMTLPAEGSAQAIPVPDPKVSRMAATFTLTPIMFDKRPSTPRTFQVLIQNGPYFSQPLSASPASGDPGAGVTLTWTVEVQKLQTRAVLTSDYPGAAPLDVDPAAGRLAVTLPDGIVVPGPITYTLTVTRGGYSSTSAIAVQMKGNARIVWCRGRDGTGGSRTYLPTLARESRLTSIMADAVRDDGSRGPVGVATTPINVIAVRYNNGAFSITPDDRDRQISHRGWDWETHGHPSFRVIDLWFAHNGSDPVLAYLWVNAQTPGNSMSAGFGIAPPAFAESLFHVEAAENEEIVALAWSVSRDRTGFDGIGVILASPRF